MLKITYFILLVNLIVSTSSFAQTRKIENNVYSNFREGKLDLALVELESMQSKYAEKPFFYYWKAFIYMEKISQLKKFDYLEINRDSARFFIDKSLRFLIDAPQYLTADELSINKEDFDVLFPGCLVTLPEGETKYTNCGSLIERDFQSKKEYLRGLQYNLSLGNLIEEYRNSNRDISIFLKEIKPRVKSNPALNPLYGDVAKSTYMELANIRNQRELVQLQKDLTDKNWINYIKTYKDEEFLSIVPEIEKLINNYYFNNLENQYQKIKNNAFELKTYLANLEESKNLMETNAVNYITSKYGEIKLSNTFMNLRKGNYYKIINDGTIKMKENSERQKVFEEEFTYNETFEDNFENNTNGWSEIENQIVINKIANGKFIFENKTDGSNFNLADKTIPTNNENFLISMNTTWVKGINNNSFDIVWGANGVSDNFLFGINANGGYRYMSRQNGNYNILIPWTVSEYINKNGSNIIGVRRNENKIELYINYFKVNEFEFSEFYGDQIGMLVNGAQRIEFDDLKIAYTIFAAEEYYPDFDPSEIETIEETPIEKPIITPIKTVKIGTQLWITKNLEVTTFRNGDPITEAKTNEEWIRAWQNNQPVWCYYENNDQNGPKYGILYNWYAVNDPRGLAPMGYHIPTDEEWIKLDKFLGAGVCKKMKSTSGWNTENGSNSSGFSALPGGVRDNNGTFRDLGRNANWWSWAKGSYDNWNRNLGYDDSFGYRYDAHQSYGLYVRCIKD